MKRKGGKKRREVWGGGGWGQDVFGEAIRLHREHPVLVLSLFSSPSLSLFLSLPLNQTSRSEIDTGRTPDESQCHRFPGLGIEKNKGGTKGRKQWHLFPFGQFL